MTKYFPTIPSGSAGCAVYLSNSDGQKLTLAPLDLQANIEIRGEYRADLVYLLGAGKTLLNTRQQFQPIAFIDGILDGLDLQPGAANKISVSAGKIEVDGVGYNVAADPALTLSNSAANKCWNAIVVTKSTRALSVVKGTDGASLLNTFGDDAGQRPRIPVDSLLIGWAAVGVTPYTLESSDIDFLEQELGAIAYEVLSNHGGILLSDPLSKIHSATIGGTGAGRTVKMNCHYLDAVMVKIATAKSWNWSNSLDEATESTFEGSYKTGKISGHSVSFEQLASDKRVIDIVLKRGGACAIRWLYPNGFGYQSAATLSFNEVSPNTGFINRSVTVPLADSPVEVE